MILFRRVASCPAYERYMSVTMLRLVVTTDIPLLGVPAGTRIDLATAKAAVGRS